MVLPEQGSQVFIDGNLYEVSSHGFGYWIEREGIKYPILLWEGRWFLYLFKESDVNESNVTNFYLEDLPKETPTDKVFVIEDKIFNIERLWMGYFIQEKYLIIKRKLFYPTEIEANLINPLPPIGTNILINGVNYECQNHVTGVYIEVGDEYGVIVFLNNTPIIYELSDFIVSKTESQEEIKIIPQNINNLFKINDEIYESKSYFIGYLVDDDKLVINANILYPIKNIKVEIYYSINRIKITDEPKDSTDVFSTYVSPLEDLIRTPILHHHPLKIKPKTEIPLLPFRAIKI